MRKIKYSNNKKFCDGKESYIEKKNTRILIVHWKKDKKRAYRTENKKK